MKNVDNKKGKIAKNVLDLSLSKGFRVYGNWCLPLAEPLVAFLVWGI